MKICQFTKENGEIANLSTTCNRIQRIAQPVLYSRVKQTGSEAISKIVQTLRAKSHVAKLVKYFSRQNNHRQDYIDMSILTEDDIEWIDSIAVSPVFIKTLHAGWWHTDGTDSVHNSSNPGGN